MKNTAVTIGIVAALVLGVAGFVNNTPVVKVDVKPTPVNVNVPKGEAPVVNVAAPKVSVEAPALGAVSSPEFYSPARFFNGVTLSSVFATSSTGAGTLTAANILDKTTILSTNAGALTITLPASSTLKSFVPTAGDRVSMVIVNQGTALLTLAGGTGTLLQTASSTKTVNIGGTAILEWVRKSNTDINVLMSPGI